MATPRVAAGALFFDEAGRVMLVKPSYKPGYDIPGGYVEPGESPRSACMREIYEELGIQIEAGPLLTVDWAPAEAEGDKLLFVFDGLILTQAEISTLRFTDGEIVGAIFVNVKHIEEYLPDRLSRRIHTAIDAKKSSTMTYAEHGRAPIRGATIPGN